MKNLIIGLLLLLVASCSIDPNNVKIKSPALISALEDFIVLLENNQDFKFSDNIKVFIGEDGKNDYWISITCPEFMYCNDMIGESKLVKYPKYKIYYAFQGKKLPNIVQVLYPYQCKLKGKRDAEKEMTTHYLSTYYTFKQGRFEKMKSKSE